MSLNYWFRLLKHNKEFRSSVKVVLFIFAMALLIYFISTVMFE